MLQALNYACLQVFVNNNAYMAKLTWQSSCVITNYNKKNINLFVQAHNHAI